MTHYNILELPTWRNWSCQSDSGTWCIETTCHIKSIESAVFFGEILSPSPVFTWSIDMRLTWYMTYSWTANQRFYYPKTEALERFSPSLPIDFPWISLENPRFFHPFRHPLRLSKNLGTPDLLWGSGSRSWVFHTFLDDIVSEQFIYHALL